jgi:hypothetical protein
LARITVVILGVVCLGWNTPGVLSGQAQTFTVVRTIESELLADPFAVREGSDGTVFVSDPISKGIFRVSASGQWTQIAREGQGPGELRSFGGLALCGDTLNAPDVASRSVVRFKEDGQFLDVARVSLQAFPSPHYALVPALVLPEDKVLTVPAVFSDAIASGQLEEAPFVRFARGGAMLDTLLLQPVAGTHVKLESVYRRSVTIPAHEPVFTDAFAASEGYVWLRGFSTSEEVTWTRHSLRGGPVVQITLPLRDTIKDAAHDWLWIVRKDELDVPRLVKLKVGQL